MPCGAGCDCSFSEICFSCPNFYDFESKSCQQTCSGVELERKGSKFCRSKHGNLYEYYIDPLSSSPLEFGTRAHPFKSLNIATMEIQNELSFEKTAEIKILLKGNTEIKILKGSMRFIQIKEVEISIYSDNPSDRQNNMIRPEVMFTDKFEIISAN